MKKNILYAFSIALLFAIPCTIKSMELSDTQFLNDLENKIDHINAAKTKAAIDWLHTRLTDAEKKAYGAFEQAIQNKNWARAERIIKFFKNSRDVEALEEKVQALEELLQEGRVREQLNQPVRAY